MKGGGRRGRVGERLEDAVLLALNLRKVLPSKQYRWPLEAGKVRKHICFKPLSLAICYSSSRKLTILCIRVKIRATFKTSWFKLSESF